MQKLMRLLSLLTEFKEELAQNKHSSQYRKPACSSAELPSTSRFSCPHSKRALNLMLPLMLIGTTLISSVIAIASYQTVRQLIVEKLKQNVLLEVRQGTDEIDQWLAIQKTQIQTLANSPIVRSLNWLVDDPYL